MGNYHDVSTAHPADIPRALTTCEQRLAEVLADIVDTQHVSVDSHFFDDLGADSMLMARFCARARKQTDLPWVSMPDIYKHPTIRRLAAALTHDVSTAHPADIPRALTTCEQRLAEVLADIVDTQHVSVDSDFFDDLGADSMLMARFCARARKQTDLPWVSMPDIYKHPTIRRLAAALTTTQTRPASQPATPAALHEPPRRACNGEYVLCGALQLLFLLGYPAVTAVVAVKGYEWVSASPNLVDIYLRAVVYGGAMFLGLCILPILLKWVLVGQWCRASDFVAGLVSCGSCCVKESDRSW
ncbi:phosphopantetheine-binding protein [Streptomyces sp. NPDC001635]